MVSASLVEGELDGCGSPGGASGSSSWYPLGCCNGRIGCPVSVFGSGSRSYKLSSSSSSSAVLGRLRESVIAGGVEEELGVLEELDELEEGALGSRCKGSSGCWSSSP